MRDLATAAFVLFTAAEGMAMNASPDFYRNHGVEELATLFTRYLMADS